MRNGSTSRDWLELLSSMRFAVSLLTVLSVASIVGTVLRQNEPYNNYLNQFGPFWFPVLEKLGLYSVYNASWFLLILAFLVASTSICVWRNTPKMMREMRRFKERLREESFANFRHNARFDTTRPAAEVAASMQDYLGQNGFESRTTASGDGTLIAAKAGSWRRIGYVLTHCAIVTICLGGLLDSELPLRLQIVLAGKQPSKGAALLSDVPQSSRLDERSWSFRGNSLIPEGASSSVAIISAADGVFLQELPFTIRLRKFHIEHYSTGQPKLFASDVTVTDRETGKTFDARIEVNKPLIYKGIAAYQASFDDGGTRLKLQARDLRGRNSTIAIDTRVGDSDQLRYEGTDYRLEFTTFRPFNIENTAGPELPESERRTLAQAVRDNLGSGARSRDKRELHNVGPSFQYKLRDPSGQAREYHNYMLPVLSEGRWYLMSGMRENPSEQFRYLRMPLDDDASLTEHMRVRAALADRSRDSLVAARYAGTAVTGAGGAMDGAMRARLAQSAARVLETFGQGGFQSVAQFLETAVPETERDKAAEVYLRILQGVAWESWQLSRERDGLKRLEPTPEHGQFVQDSLNSISDSFFYGVPVYLQLSSFDEVKASVFQLTRSPGKNIVYLGSLLLVLGVFAMFYVRERRIWILVKSSGAVLMAMAASRATLDYDEEFDRHRAAVAKLTA